MGNRRGEGQGATIGSYQGATSSPTGHLTLKAESGDFSVSLESVSSECRDIARKANDPKSCPGSDALCPSRLSHLNTQNSVIGGGCSASTNPSMETLPVSDTHWLGLDISPIGNTRAAHSMTLALHVTCQTRWAQAFHLSTGEAEARGSQ